jgi:hypothetical protein
MSFKSKLTISCDNFWTGPNCDQKIETKWTTIRANTSMRFDEYPNLPEEAIAAGWTLRWNEKEQEFQWLCPEHAGETK